MRTKFMAALVVVVVVTIIVTLSSTKQTYNNESSELIPLLSGWKRNIETDHKLTIYGMYLLSTDLDSDVSHDYYCSNEDCQFVVGNDNYAIINDGGYLIFSLIDSTYLIFEPAYDVETIQAMVKDGIIYGLVYHDENEDIYYDINTKEYYLNGRNAIIDSDTRYVSDKNIVIYETDGKYYVYDYKNDDVLIEANYLQVDYIENIGDYYITTFDTKGNMLALYDSNLNRVEAINAKEATIYNKSFIMTYDNKSFVVKNINGDVVTSSKQYESIKGFVDGNVIATLDDNLMIIDINDDVIKEIPLDGRNYMGVRKETDNKLHFYLEKDGNQIEATFDPKTFEYQENEI